MHVANGNSGVFEWYTAPSGTAGDLISFTERLRITSAGVLDVLSGQIKFPATQVASSDPNTLDWYAEPSYTATATGLTTSPTATVNFVRAGNKVTVALPAISGTSNATTFTLTGGPTTMRPSAARVVQARVQDNGGAVTWGMASIGTDGVITLSADANGAAFTASGTKATAACSFSYII
jgi:hypothetical protein